MSCTAADGRGSGQQHREMPDSYTNQRVNPQQQQQRQQMPIKKQAQHMQRQDPPFHSHSTVCVTGYSWQQSAREVKTKQTQTNIRGKGRNLPAGRNGKEAARKTLAQ